MWEYSPPQKNLIFPPPKKKNTYQVIFVFGPRIIHCYKKLTIKLLFNFNNFNSRLPPSSQYHIKYSNPKKAHPCVIPRILSHHVSKSVKAFDLCACLRKKSETKSFQLLGATPPDSVTRGSAPGSRWRQARSYVQARGGSCLLVPRRLNFLRHK